jgi:hypothetical protein
MSEGREVTATRTRNYVDAQKAREVPLLKSADWLANIQAGRCCPGPSRTGRPHLTNERELTSVSTYQALDRFPLLWVLLALLEQHGSSSLPADYGQVPMEREKGLELAASSLEVTRCYLNSGVVRIQVWSTRFEVLHSAAPSSSSETPIRPAVQRSRRFAGGGHENSPAVTV